MLNQCIFPGKFSLKNTVINVVAGLGLLGFISIFCDFILLNYLAQRKIVSDEFCYKTTNVNYDFYNE